MSACLANPNQGSRTPPGGRGAFTLIEVMMVVAVMGLLMAMGMPAIVTAMKKEGMRRAVNDVVDGCTKARALAIVSGGVAELRFFPKDKRLEVGVGSAPPKDEEGSLGAAAEPRPAPVGSGFSAQLPETIAVEMWDVNLTEFKDAEVARVKFYPNGMCDEMTVVLRSERGEWRKIALEVTTGRSTVGDVR